jgi:hypothetical protein
MPAILGETMKLRVWFMAVLLTSLFPAALSANTWYVDGNNGSDSNSCNSSTAACKTITHAISLAASGDSIMIAPSSYYESLTIPFSLNLVGANPRNTNLHPGGNQVGGAAGPSIITIPNASSEVSLSGLTIAGGNSERDGGAISNYGQLTITNCVIANNRANFFGGGISTHGSSYLGGSQRASLTINKSSIWGNKAPEGGGIQCSTPSYAVRIVNSAIYNNEALSGNGGGILNGTGGPGAGDECGMAVINTTISENGAAGQGSGVYGDMILSNVTINDGIYVTYQTLMQNTIVAGDPPGGTGANCAGAKPTSYGYNLSTDDSCSLTGPGDLNSTDPMLGPLQDNGGPTWRGWTMALPSNSPAIDAGNPTGCTDIPKSLGYPVAHLLPTDQRGYKRPGDPKLTTGCDIGAYEYQFPK